MASPFSPTEARSPLMRDKKSDSAPAEKPVEFDATDGGGGGGAVVVGAGGAAVVTGFVTVVVGAGAVAVVGEVVARGGRGEVIVGVGAGRVVVVGGGAVGRALGDTSAAVVVVGGGAVGRVLGDTSAAGVVRGRLMAVRMVVVVGGFVVVALASVVLGERRTAVVDETRAEGTIVPPAR